MRIHLCGVRGSTPAPGAEFLRYGGHTSCVAIAHNDGEAPTLILDAGTGLRRVTGLLIHDAFWLPEEAVVQALLGHAAADYAVAAEGQVIDVVAAGQVIDC